MESKGGKSKTGESRAGIKCHDCMIDVASDSGSGQNLRTAITICLPDPGDIADNPIVAFAFPGATYSRKYFTRDVSGDSSISQAEWHCRRGWIFVAVDSLGVGEAGLPGTVDLSLQRIVAGNHYTVTQVLERLAKGTMVDDFPPIHDPTVLGFGQSMGGGLTIAQQAYHDSYHGIGILGFSPVWTTSRGLPGGQPAGIPFLARGAAPAGDVMSHEARCAASTNTTLMKLQASHGRYPTPMPTPPGWNDFFDDVPAEVRNREITFDGDVPAWRSKTMPSAVFWMLAPGSLGPEAAAVVVPVLSAFGERDVSEDPRLEQKAFRHAVDFSSFICPRMGHMHNFATTRQVLWSRIHSWGTHVSELRKQLPDAWPSQLFSDSY